MKVLLVSESYWPNADGGALFERRLAHGLSQREFEMTIWAPGNRARSYLEIDGPTTIEREKALRFLFNKKYKVSYFPYFRARTMIRRHRPDVIHIHNFYLMGIATLFWAQIYRVPVIATNHFMPENLLLNLSWLKPIEKTVHRLVWRYLVSLHNRCNFVTSPTPTATRLLVEHGLTAPHEAITNGVDAQIFRPVLKTTEIRKKYNVPFDKQILLYFGRLDGEKRLDVIIDSLPLILKKHSVQLVLAGSGIARPALEAQARRLKVQDNVTFTGFIDEADKPVIYNAADIFVLSSPAELQSIVTLEAMACSLPVVLVDVAALHELCHDGENGYLFAENDSTMLAVKVMDVLGDKKTAIAFGKASRQIIETAHTTEKMLTKYADAYHLTLTSGRLDQ